MCAVLSQPICGNSLQKSQETNATGSSVRGSSKGRGTFWNMGSEMPVTHLMEKQAKKGFGYAGRRLMEWSEQSLSAPRSQSLETMRSRVKRKDGQAPCPEELSTLRGQVER